jgi:hypothetical protein
MREPRRSSKKLMPSLILEKALPRFVVVLALSAIPAMASAKCAHPPIPWKFGGSISSSWRSTDGSVCVSTSNHPNHIASIEITSKPSNGVAGKNGPFGVAYKPNPGFRGSDAFSYAVTSNAQYRKGAGMVAHVTVYVSVE